MSETPKKFYLTTPIYYVNARPHIGHAYTTIVADVLARRHRLLGDDTFFLTGTDEHGQKIERSAAAAGVPPQEFADRVSIEFRNLWDRMGLTYDGFIRTTDEKHKRGAQKLFAELYERGEIYLSSYTGQYSIGEEVFVEGPPGVLGPDGKPTETVTEENFFFKLSKYQLRLLDLIESDTLAITPESRKNEVLGFLRGNVAEAREKGLEVAKSAAGFEYVPGNLRGLSVSRSSFTWGIPVPEPAASATAKKHVMYVWLDALANYMTAVGYGSDDPKDQAEFARYWPADVHIMAKEITRQHCIYWPAFLMAAGLPLPKAVTAHGWLLFDNSKMSKSKGNIVRTETILDGFGTLCPPVFDLEASHAEGLDAEGPDAEGPTGGSSGLQPTESASAPKGALAPGFRPPAKAERDLFASDVLRYFLLREIPFGQDGSFSFEAMIARYNADLANGYGNLVSRTLNMVGKYFEYFVPEIDFEAARKVEVLGKLQMTFGGRTEVFAPLLLDFDELRLDRYLQRVQVLISVADETVSLMTPWKERDTESATKQNRAFALYYVAEAVRLITALLYPVLPSATAKVWLQLGLGDIEEAARNGELKNLQWGGLKPGTKLGPLAPIFPRADKGLAQIMSDMENPPTTDNREPTTQARTDAPLKSAATPTPAQPVTEDPTHPAAGPRTSTLVETAAGTHVGGSAAVTTERSGTPSHTEAPASGIFAPKAVEAAGQEDGSAQITIDDFAKVELRVAQIVVAERIPKADKLLRLEVDLGYERRQILSGIAEWYRPEDLVGRRIVVITNLAPRKMRGLESHGMLLAASDGEGGKPVLATFGEEIALGSRLK